MEVLCFSLSLDGWRPKTSRETRAVATTLKPKQEEASATVWYKSSGRTKAARHGYVRDGAGALWHDQGQGWELCGVPQHQGKFPFLVLMIQAGLAFLLVIKPVESVRRLSDWTQVQGKRPLVAHTMTENPGRWQYLVQRHCQTLFSNRHARQVYKWLWVWSVAADLVLWWPATQKTTETLSLLHDVQYLWFCDHSYCRRLLSIRQSDFR